MRTEYNDNTLKIFLDDIGIPTIDIVLTSTPIVAKTRKLRARWTPELSQELDYWYDMKNDEINNHRPQRRKAGYL